MSHSVLQCISGIDLKDSSCDRNCFAKSLLVDMYAMSYHPPSSHEPLQFLDQQAIVICPQHHGGGDGFRTVLNRQLAIMIKEM